MDVKKRFCQFIAKILVFTIIMQGMPLWQISQTYFWELDRQKIQWIVDCIASGCSIVFSPAIANAGTPHALGNYTINRIPENFVDISGSGTQLNLGDEGGMSGILIGFDFEFFGVSNTTLAIVANGYLSFDTLITRENTAIPLPDAPNSLIAPFWDDLNPEHNPDSAVYFTTTGSAPDRVFIVQWQDIPLNTDPDSRLTFEVLLFEGNQEIQFQYTAMTDGSGTSFSGPASGSSATIGIESDDGTRGNQVSFKKDGAVGPGNAFSFTLEGNAFQQGRLAGDLDDDDEDTILDQSMLTDTVDTETAPRTALNLLLSDIWPSPGDDGRNFGDGIINANDHALLFEVIMGRADLHPLLSASFFIAAGPGEVLTLYGSDFDPVAGNNSVIFTDINGTEISVAAESADAAGMELQVTVPAGMGYIVDIRVTRGGLPSNALTFVLEGLPMICGLIPSHGNHGDTILIRGFQFSPTPGENNVSFNGADATVAAVLSDGDADVLQVIVPSGAGSGPVTVSVNSVTSNEMYFSVREPLQAAITTPETDTDVTAPVEIIGTAWDENLDYYVLEYASAGTNDFTEFARGTTIVEEDVLGTFDPTLLENGIYAVRLTAFNLMGQFRSTMVNYFVKGSFKAGLFTLSFVDLEVPLSGVPIELVRTYDSRKRGQSDDFGYGWTLTVKSYPKIQKNRPEGQSWTSKAYPGRPPQYTLEGLEEHALTVTLADGRTLDFDFKPQPSRQAVAPITYTTAAYEARPGTSATLEPIGDKDLVVCGNELCTYDLYLYDPQRFKLTLEDRTVYELEIGKGVNRVEDRYGNELTITDSGIFHSSGESILFSRDAQNRIITVTDPAGSTLSYNYDANDDLITVTDRNNNTTTFNYLEGHYLDSILDSLGRQVSKSEYNASGRLVAHIDAKGNRTEYTHNLSARQQIVQDRLGNITVHEYNDRGYVLSSTDPLGHHRTFAYDDQGNRLSETDPFGNTKTYTYDNEYHLLTETDPLGNTTTYTYNASGQVITKINPLGNVWSNVYSPNGDLIEKHDPAGGVTYLSYNAKGQEISRTNALGHTTVREYDTKGRMTKTTDPLSNEITYEYNNAGNQSKISKTRTTATGPVVMVTEFTYDSHGNLLTTTDPNGVVVKYEYNALHQKFSETYPFIESEPDENRTEFAYDVAGNLVTTLFRDATTTAATFDAERRKTSETDPLGRVTVYEYDVFGNMKKAVHPDGSSIEYCYDAGGRLSSTQHANGEFISYEYDACGRRIKTTDALNNETFYEYDAAGQRTKMIDPIGRQTVYKYDKLGKQNKIIFNDGSTKEITCDLLGRKISETDQAGLTSIYEYDQLGRLIKVIDAAGQDIVYTYDEVDNKISQTDANGHLTHWTYDNTGRLTSRTLPLGMTETFTYHLNGNVSSKKDFNGDIINFEYDALNQLTAKHYPDNTSVSYTYTDTGKRASAMDVSGLVTTYTYDDRDRLTNVVNPDGSSVAYTYDPMGNRLSVTVANGATVTSSHTYEYDVLNRLTKVIDATNHVTLYEYDSLGNRTKVTYPNGCKANYTYDSLNRLTKLENVASDGTTILSSYTYTLGAAGNRQKVVEHTGRTVDYTYDNLYRLTEEKITCDPNGANDIISYTYDSFGNRSSKTDSAGQVTYIYDHNDRLVIEIGSGYTYTYSYDNNGNRTEKDDDTISIDYTFDYDNRLVSVNKAASSITYMYDIDGLRISQEVEGEQTHYLFDKNRAHAQVLEERTSSGTMQAMYVWGNTIDPLYMERNGTVYYYLVDGNLNIRKLANDNDTVTDTYEPDAFGNILYRTGNTPNHYILHGQYYDANSGFYYLRARWMDPSSGVFTSQDPVTGSIFEPHSLHKYMYARNNPLSYYDPSGLFSLIEMLSVVSVIDVLLAINYMYLDVLLVAKDTADKYLKYAAYARQVSIDSMANGVVPIWAQDVPKMMSNAFKIMNKRMQEKVIWGLIKAAIPIKIGISDITKFPKTFKWLNKHIPSIAASAAKFGLFEFDASFVVGLIESQGNWEMPSSWIPAFKFLGPFGKSVTNMSKFLESIAKGGSSDGPALDYSINVMKEVLENCI